MLATCDLRMYQIEWPGTVREEVSLFITHPHTRIVEILGVCVTQKNKWIFTVFELFLAAEMSCYSGGISETFPS